MTGKARVFATIRVVLDQRGVDWAVLHGADHLPDGWRNDLDLWVDERFDEATLHEMTVQLQRVGHPVVQSFESSVGTRALWCDPRGGSPIQLDFSRQILAGTGVRVVSGPELCAAVDRSGAFPTLDAGGSFLYLLAKRLEKGVDDDRALAELRSAAARAGEDSALRITRRLVGERAAGLDAALAAGLPGANAWLRARRRAFFLRMVAADPLGFLDVQAHNARRLIERLVRPGGLAVDSTDAPALRHAVAADLEGVFRDVVTTPRRPSIDVARNRLVVREAVGNRRARSRLFVPSTCGDAADRIASVQVDRVARRHHATSPTSLPVLCYHAIGLEPALRRGGKVRWEIDPDRFEGDLDALTAAGYQVRSLAAHDPDGGPQVVLTIDDANTTDLDVVLPMLRARAMTATFFVPTRRVDQVGYLDRCGVRELVGAGMEIGSHGHDHRPMTDLSASAQRDDLVRSKEMLEEITGRAVTSFAYPGGVWDPALADRVAEVGYRNACTVQWRHAVAGLADFHVPRCIVGNGFYAIDAASIASRSIGYRARQVAREARRVVTG